ncbi:hypothetical protein MMB17_02910 [Methylobacterium organophilum]|uniref:hypothetical protein n=1 Tax=Methylobacterium organophilum TaxID=410 RepID=UPI001F146A77|nr:hypothetical protein [Methylobacterium organophilum]UMY19999.1 hypothetical protein MMB17_02910 [Methylobacterium organophilum]
MKARAKKRLDSEDSIETVSIVKKIGPTYAKGLHHLAGLGLGIRQGESYARMRLDFELNCGTAAFQSNGRDFGISLRVCHISLSRKNCEVEVRSRYEHSLVNGSFEISGTEVRSSEQLRDRNLNVEGGLNASAISPALFAKIAGGFRWGKKKNEKLQETSRRQVRIDLISTFGHDRWRVGDPRLGDARRTDGKLAGTYFGEERDSDGEPRPLCIVSRQDPTLPVQVTISVSAPIGQVVIECADEPASASERSATEAALRARSLRAQKEHATAQSELQSRVAGLTLGKAIAEAQREAGLQLPDGEFLIARQTLSLVRPALLEDEKENL